MGFFTNFSTCDLIFTMDFGSLHDISAEALHDFPSEWPGVVERLVVGLRSEQNVVDSE